MAPYGVAVSNSTNFSTWLPYRLLPNATQQTKIWGDHSTNVGSARPKIETMADGALLLAGGRPSGAKEDPMLWLNANGDAEIWQPYSVSYWHNTLINQSCCWRNTTPYVLRIWPFDAHLNGSQFPRQSTSYNSLIRTNGTHGAWTSVAATLVYRAMLSFSMNSQLPWVLHRFHCVLAVAASPRQRVEGLLPPVSTQLHAPAAPCTSTANPSATQEHFVCRGTNARGSAGSSRKYFASSGHSRLPKQPTMLRFYSLSSVQLSHVRHTGPCWHEWDFVAAT
jgi:hypothetical protein